MAKKSICTYHYFPMKNSSFYQVLRFIEIIESNLRSHINVSLNRKFNIDTWI